MTNLVIETKFIDQYGKIHRVFCEQDYSSLRNDKYILGLIFDKWPQYKSYEILELPRIAYNSSEEMPDNLRHKESYSGDVRLLHKFTSNGVEHRTYCVNVEFSNQYRIESEYGYRILGTTLDYQMDIMEAIGRICARHERALLSDTIEQRHEYQAQYYDNPAVN